MAEASERWLLDTNIVIDLLVGFTCYAITRVLGRRGMKHCDTILISTDRVIQDTALRNRLQDEVISSLEAMTRSLREQGIELAVTSTTVDETRSVIERLRRHEQSYNRMYRNHFRGRVVVVLLPAGYLLSYDAIAGTMFRHSLLKVVDVGDMRSEAEQAINTYLGGRYDREDWHLVAALLSDHRITAIYTEEDRVAHGLKRIAEEHSRRRVDVGGFSALLASLRTLGALTAQQAHITGYYAYKFQRLLHSHRNVYMAGLQQQPGSGEQLPPDALAWIAYSQRRLQHYIPPQPRQHIATGGYP